MKSHTSDPLLEAWDGTVARLAGAPALFDTRGIVSRTFAEIEEAARALEQGLMAQLAAHEIVAVQIGNHPAWPSLLLASLRRQLVVLPLEQTISVQERRTALKACGAARLITATGNNLAMKGIDPESQIDWDGKPPVLLKLTSGTTAAPRAIRFQSAQLLADCIQICETMGITERDLNFGVIPVSHSYGFSNLITPLLARGVPLVPSGDRIPRAVLDDLARTRATVFPGMPVFYQAFCEMDELPELPDLRLCISAGAPLPLPVAQKFREKFRQSIHSFYGSSECGGICYDRVASLLEPDFIGPAMMGVEVQRLDPDAALSQVRVRSRAVADGYFPAPEGEKLGSGSFVPDDLLSESGDGWRIAGRVSDVINVAGKKVSPAEVEATLLRFKGVQEAAVFGLDSSRRNQEVAACVVAADAVEEADLLAFCRARLSGWQTPKRIFFVEKMPVNERGKISRRNLAERFQS